MLFHEEVFREYPNLKEYIRKHREKNEITIQEIIIKGQKEGLFDINIDPSVFAIIYMGSIRMLITKWRQDNFSPQIEEEAKKVLNQLLQFLQIYKRKSSYTT